MLTPEAMLSLAVELTDAAETEDATSLAAIAWRLYSEAGENLAEIGRLRAAIHAAWNRPQETAPLAPSPPRAAGRCCTAAEPGRRREQTDRPSRQPWVLSADPGSTPG